MNSEWYAHDFMLTEYEMIIFFGQKKRLYFNFSTLVSNETLVKLLVGAFLSFQVHS